MVEPPTLGQVYVGETSVDVGSNPTPVSMTSTLLLVGSRLRMTGTPKTTL